MSGRVFVIAEAGVNHNGSLARALDMVDAAVDAGADAVKFQTFSADRLVTREAPKADYQQRTTDASETQYEMLKALELTEDDHAVLKARCEQRGVAFMSAAFDPESVELLARLGVDRIKVASGEITNLPYLRRVAALGLPLFLSTGMATLDEVAQALEALEAAGLPRSGVVVLQCTSEYPTPAADVNLTAMCAMRDALGVRVGYSDHTEGITAAVAAAALGASVIEKHFTLDRELPGPDHQASLEPDELAEMVRAIRFVEQALGHGDKRPAPSEAATAVVARKSIVAARPIRAGEVFSAESLAAKRPGTGISPMRWDEVVGTVAKRDYAADEPLDAAQLETREARDE